MDHPPPGPSKIRKRATKACLACRARKVRCDVSQRGRPCMNCYLDGESCIVTGRASRRRNPKEDGVDNSAAAEDGGPSLLQGCDSGEPRLGHAQTADAEGLMDTASEGGSGSERPDMQGMSRPGVSAVHMTCVGRRSDTQIPEPRSPVAFPPCAPRPDPPAQQQQPSIPARPQQLQWAGERSIIFGADITYTYYSFLTLDNLSNILPQDVTYLEMQGCLRVPIRPHLDEFVKHYFLHVHPILPLLNEGDVWEMYGSQPSVSPASDKLPLLMLQAMMFSACPYVPRSTIKDLGFADVGAAQAAFYRRAKLLFDFEAESSPITIAQTALLMSSWNPGAGRQRVHVGGSWVRVALEHAKLARAHLYWTHPRNPKATKRDSCLKRLWWCIILQDRLLSMFSQKPIQVTPAQFDTESHASLRYDDLADEVQRSRVYNGEAKKSLLEFLEQMMKLAVALTDLLLVLYPLDDIPNRNKRSVSEERMTIKDCRRRMKFWATEAGEVLRAPKPRENADPPDFSHGSVVLYHDFAYLLYHSSMTRLFHFECIRSLGGSGCIDVDSTVSPYNNALEEQRRNLGNETLAVVSCLTELVRLRLSRLLPLGSIACALLPLILSMIELKMAPTKTSRLELPILELDELSRSSQSQQDAMDSMSFAIRDLFDLAHLEVLDRPTPTRSVAEGEDGATNWEFSHPSVYLRLALGVDLDLGSSSSPGPTDLSAILERLFASSTANRVEAILGQREKTWRKPATGSPEPKRLASSSHEKSIQRNMATWMEHDQAISYGVQLGIVPPDLAGEERQESGSGSESGEDGDVSSQQSVEGHEWKEIMAEAFSEKGDVLEGNLLNELALRALPSGAS